MSTKATNQQRREAAKRKLERQLTRRAERARRRKIIGVAVTVGAVLVAAGLIVVLGMSSDDSAAEDTTEQPQAEGAEEIEIPSEPIAAPQRPEPLPDSVTCEYPESGEAAKPVDAPSGDAIPATGTVPVTLQSTVGDIPLVLDRALAPCAVNSFISLAEQDFYTDTSCHRLGTDGLQMLQCGDPTGTGSGGPGYTFADEVFDELQYGRGLLAMANSGPDTNGSQFFMVYGEAPLPPDYTVFGTITDEGLTVLDEIARGGHDGRFDPSPGGGKPHTDVTFTGATVDN